MYENQIIFGIGNEVFWAITSITVLSGFLALVIYHVSRSWTRHRGLHALSQDAVNSVRSYLRYSSRLDPHGTGAGEMEHFGPDNQCPICLIEPHFPIETNCGHLFCANCIVVYWRQGSWTGAVRCPVCRQQVTLLLRCFTDSEIAEPERSERNNLLREINDYNRRFSGEPRPWLDYVWDLPTLLRHLTSEFFTLGGLMYMFRIRVVLCFLAALMYLISPLDMIPEAMFGILGLLDDLFVVLLLAVYVTVVYRRFLAGRWQEDN